MHLAIWLAALAALIVVLNSRRKLSLGGKWSEPVLAAVVVAWAIALMLTFPVVNWGGSASSDCRTDFDKAGQHIVCD